MKEIISITLVQIQTCLHGQFVSFMYTNDTLNLLSVVCLTSSAQYIRDFMTRTNKKNDIKINL